MCQKNKFKKNISLLNGLLVLIVTGCASFQEPLLPIDLAGIHGTTLIEQQLQIKTSTRPIVIDAVLFLSPERINLTGSLMGVKVFHFIYDGQKLSDMEVNKLPSGISSHTIFNHAMYVFAPTASLLKALPQQAIYTEQSNFRKIILPSGEEIDITYTKDSDIAGQAILSKSKSTHTILFKYVISFLNKDESAQASERR